MRRATVIGGLVAAVVLVATSGAPASLMTDANAMTGWKGSQQYTTSPEYLDVLVEYAVYTSENFELSFGIDLGEGLYVYAYEVFNDLNGHLWPDEDERDYVRRFSVDLHGDELPDDDGFVADAGQDPDESSISGSKTSVGWWFYDPSLNYGSYSDVLYFSSPYGPEWDDATVTGYEAVTHDLPSPAPEPTTLALLSVSGGLALLRRRR